MYSLRLENRSSFYTLLFALVDYQLPTWVLQPTQWEQNRRWRSFMSGLVPPVIRPTRLAILVNIDLSIAVDVYYYRRAVWWYDRRF